jgi:hypothetical protein
VEQGENISRKVRRLQWSRVRTSQATHRQGANKTGNSLRLHTGRVREKQDIPSGGQYSRVRENQDSSQATHRQGANSLQAALRRGENLPGQGESEGVEFFFWLDNIQIC